MKEYPSIITSFVKKSDSKKLGLLTKYLSDPIKFRKSLAIIGEDVINSFNSIKWEEPDLPISLKIQWIKQDIFTHPVCLTCGSKLKWISSLTKYNDSYCSSKCYGGDSTRVRKKEFDVNLAVKLYTEDKKSFSEIAKIIGDVSNVTVKKRLVEMGVKQRSHSEECTINHYSGPYKGPVVNYNADILKDEYLNKKIPINVLGKIYGCHPETIRRFLNKSGVMTTKRHTKPEFIIKTILERNGIRFKPNDRKVIAPREIDFLLVDYKIGIEVHGLYHHSVISGNKSKQFHREKFIAAEKKWIQTIPILGDGNIRERKNHRKYDTIFMWNF